MGYRVHRQDNTFKVVFVDHGETRDVITDIAEDSAKKISANLNSSGGFNGVVPAFFHCRLKQSDINTMLHGES